MVSTYVKTIDTHRKLADAISLAKLSRYSIDHLPAGASTLRIGLLTATTKWLATRYVIRSVILVILPIVNVILIYKTNYLSVLYI